jgi:DNA-binding PadR family transcriptional regulator
VGRGQRDQSQEGGRPHGHGEHQGGDAFEATRFGHGEARHGGRGGGSPFGPRGAGFGRGPHIGRGDVRAATLALLAEGPQNGYQIIQQIAERSGGIWRPSSGSVYPGLQLLEDEGLIQQEMAEGRRVFRLTDAGRAHVEARREELARVWDTVAGRVDDAALELRDLFEQVGAAVAQVARAGNDAEISEARRLLVETRRRLYRILAGDVGGDEPTGSDPR